MVNEHEEPTKPRRLPRAFAHVAGITGALSLATLFEDPIKWRSIIGNAVDAWSTVVVPLSAFLFSWLPQALPFLQTIATVLDLDVHVDLPSYFSQYLFFGALFALGVLRSFMLVDPTSEVLGLGEGSDPEEVDSEAVVVGHAILLLSSLACFALWNFALFLTLILMLFIWLVLLGVAGAIAVVLSVSGGKAPDAPMGLLLMVASRTLAFSYLVLVAAMWPPAMVALALSTLMFVYTNPFDNPEIFDLWYLVASPFVWFLGLVAVNYAVPWDMLG